MGHEPEGCSIRCRCPHRCRSAAMGSSDFHSKKEHVSKSRNGISLYFQHTLRTKKNSHNQHAIEKNNHNQHAIKNLKKTHRLLSTVTFRYTEYMKTKQYEKKKQKKKQENNTHTHMQDQITICKSYRAALSSRPSTGVPQFTGFTPSLNIELKSGPSPPPFFRREGSPRRRSHSCCCCCCCCLPRSPLRP